MTCTCCGQRTSATPSVAVVVGRGSSATPVCTAALSRTRVTNQPGHDEPEDEHHHDDRRSDSCEDPWQARPVGRRRPARPRRIGLAPGWLGRGRLRAAGVPTCCVIIPVVARLARVGGVRGLVPPVPRLVPRLTVAGVAAWFGVGRVPVAGVGAVAVAVQAFTGAAVQAVAVPGIAGVAIPGVPVGSTGLVGVAGRAPAADRGASPVRRFSGGLRVPFVGVARSAGLTRCVHRSAAPVSGGLERSVTGRRRCAAVPLAR